MKSRTIKAIIFGVGLLFMMDCYAQSNSDNFWNISDFDTIRFANPDNVTIGQYITGTIFKAIDPRFIANVHGSTKIERVNYNSYDKNKGFKKIVTKEFSLIAFDYHHYPNYEVSRLFTSLNAQKKWNYYINDNLLNNYARVLISALIPQAIERIEFIPTDNLKLVAVNSDSPIKSQGSIHYYTRDISKSTISDSTTVYILNDDRIITRKIYEAINPVFICSLKRINNQAEMAEYEYKGITEIVKINLFKLEEVVNAVSINDCPECDVYIVDNIQIDWKTHQVLNKYHFKEICEIVEEDKKSFAPYRKLFPSGKLKWGSKTVTIISL